VTELDLRGTPCPLNYIRTKLALEGLPGGDQLRVSLDRGEPQQMVVDGITAAGHQVVVSPHADDQGAVVLLITPHG
jgi:TusA-related sulfurtransferase